MIRLSNYSNIFGNTGSIYNNLAQLNSVRRGTYGKALKAYYAKENITSASKSSSGSKSNRYKYSSYTADAGLSEIQTQSGKLTESAAKLTDNSKKSLFADKDDYNADEAYKAVSEFVSEYNDTLSAVNKTTNTTVTNAADNMTRMTKVMSYSLSKVGVSVGKDGRLSVDEETFKNTVMDKVKSVFGPGGSFARSVGSYSARLGNAAKTQSLQAANNTGIYGKYGSYNNNYGINSYNWWY